MAAGVVLGLGGCTDYEIAWDAAVVGRLAAAHGIRCDELGTAVVVRDERDLLRSVLAFLRDGVGGERFVASSDLLRDFAAHFAFRTTLGGTNVRAAIAMSRLGLRSTLHLVSVDDAVREQLPDAVSWICSSAEDSTDPHLIVQFPAGSRVRLVDGEVVAPQANRLIYVNDAPNRELVLSPRLRELLGGAGVFLVSGFNAMQDPAVLEARLQELREHMRALPEGALVLYEDAGFHVPEFSRRVRERLLGSIDVFSMNEDEMGAYLGREVDLLDAADVSRALQQLHRLVPARTLVVHTKHWSLALGREAEAYRAALRSGNAMSGTRYLHGDGFTAADFARVEAGERRPDGAAFAVAVEALLPGQVCCEPSYRLLSAAPTTVGLGDTFVGGFITALVQRSARRDGQVA